MGYSLCTMADFQNCLISRIFGAFWNGFFFDVFRLKCLLQVFTLFFGNTKNFRLIFCTYRKNCICAKKELF